MKITFNPIIIAGVMLLISLQITAQTNTTENTRSIFAVEADPIVPLILHGIGGHLMWQPKTSRHFVFGFAVVAFGKMPDFIINMDSKNKDQGWKYKINQGFGVETEYYYKQPNMGWFTGLQLFTQEIDLTNRNVPFVTEHRTNTGMAVITTGYKWFPFKKQHFYLKPWGGFGYSGIIKGAFSSKVIPNTIVGNYEYHLQKFTPFATVHIGFKF
jgi:hypothetical protein